MSDPWTNSGCHIDPSILNNPSALDWADLFVKVHPGLEDGHSIVLGWFGNAMNAMRTWVHENELEAIKKEKVGLEWKLHDIKQIIEGD